MYMISTETDGCVSTAQPISMSRPSLNGVEMRPQPARAVSLPEGERIKTGMTNARQSGTWYIVVKL